MIGLHEERTQFMYHQTWSTNLLKRMQFLHLQANKLPDHEQHLNLKWPKEYSFQRYKLMSYWSKRSNHRLDPDFYYSNIKQ